MHFWISKLLYHSVFTVQAGKKNYFKNAATIIRFRSKTKKKNPKQIYR